MQVATHIRWSGQVCKVVFLQRLDCADHQVHLTGDLFLTETSPIPCISQHQANGLRALLGILLHYNVSVTLLYLSGTKSTV